MKTLLLMLAVASCTAQTGTAGPQGPAGPTGPQGPAGSSGGAAGGRLAWKDATGALVARDSNIYQDAAGWVWFLDSETARPNSSHGVVALWYTGASCSGTAYVNASLPRAPFKVPGSSAFRARPDTLAFEMPTLVSARDAGNNCITASLSGTRMVPFEETAPPAPIIEPSWSFVAPLHVEREP